MKLTTQQLPDWFSIATPQNSHYQEPTNCLDFIGNDSSVLLVTIGESWTFGSELGRRLEQVWGRLTARHFGWDWLNLAQPGCGNFIIAEWAEQLAEITDQLDYEKIIVICLFTEVGRGFNSHHDLHLDYNTWLAEYCNSSEDFYKFIEMINANCVARIIKASENKFSVWFASNFVDHLGLPAQRTLPEPWFRVLGMSCDTKTYCASLGVEKLQQIIDFLPKEKISMFKTWMIDMITQSESVDKICAQSAQGRTKNHPDAGGHKIWADYVIKHLESHETI